MASPLHVEILRIASELPVGDPTRRELLSSLKEAGAPDVIWKVIDRRGYQKLRAEMRSGGDDQSVKLIDQIGRHLLRAMQLSDNEQRALNRLTGSINSVGRWDASLQRNNIFKAANLLGIKLPSGMFASDRSKVAYDEDWYDGDPSAPDSPWGPVQSRTELGRGVYNVETAGHGGIGVERSAQNQLSPAAKREGDSYGGILWYEEDMMAILPLFDVPEWRAMAERKGLIGKKDDDYWLKAVIRSHPRYAKAQGLI